MKARSPLQVLLKKIVPMAVRESRRYRRAHGRFPNLLRPTRFTEKVILRKLYDRNPLYASCSDKFLVRRYVGERIGKDALVPLLAATRRPEDLLDIAEWRMTVIKPNHGSLMVAIYGDEEPSLDEKQRQMPLFRSWLQSNYAERYNEPHYARIDPVLLMERNIADSGVPPREWKVHCFRQADGSVRVMIQVIHDRFEAKAMTFYLGGHDAQHIIRSIGDMPPVLGDGDRPLLSQALAKSIVLSGDFDYVRVDWMLSKGRLYFSELTFTPGAGFSTTFGKDLDHTLGALWVERRAR